jgi:hypothetical protein
MKVENVRIYDLEESLIASGYPMRTMATQERDLDEKDIKRGHNLSKACDTGNGAHGQFMTGIRVSFDLTFTNKAWVEAERYRFLEFVSSQSTMHRITKFDLREQYNEYVDPRIIDIMEEKVMAYNLIQHDLEIMRISLPKKYSENAAYKILQDKATQKYLEILYSNPAGFNLTARMTTNYRCLKNIYIQRKNHRLPEWREFCKWIETLPYFEELINTNKYEND